MAKITFLVYDHCMYSGVSGLIDAFSIAETWRWREKGGDVAADPLFDIETVSWKGKPVLSNGNVWITPNRAMEDVNETDLVIVSPFLLGVHELPPEKDEMLEWMISQYNNNARIGASCTGAYFLAMTGLLNGRIATTNWQIVKFFRRRFPDVLLKPERILTADSGLVCSGATSALYHMALYFIELFGSEQLSRVCSKAFLIDSSRTMQKPYMMAHFRKDHGDGEILKAQSWLEENYAGSITIDQAAQQVNLSPRHFKRRFKKAVDETPLAYLQQIRLEAAKRRLETTRDNIDEITRQIGYEDSSTFRRLFKKLTDLSPREYRDKFGARSASW